MLKNNEFNMLYRETLIRMMEYSTEWDRIGLKKEMQKRTTIFQIVFGVLFILTSQQFASYLHERNSGNALLEQTSGKRDIRHASWSILNICSCKVGKKRSESHN